MLRCQGHNFDFVREENRLLPHFARVDRELLAPAAAAAVQSPAARRARARHLAELRGYARARRFPRNDTVKGRIPVFIDSCDRRCAVGALLIADGREDLARRIAHARNNAFIAEMYDAELTAWAESAGLSLRELALIQPSYDSPQFNPDYRACAESCMVCDAPVASTYRWDGTKLAAQPNVDGDSLFDRRVAQDGWRPDGIGGLVRPAQDGELVTFDLPPPLGFVVNVGDEEAWFTGNQTISHLRRGSLTTYDARGAIRQLARASDGDVWATRSGSPGALRWSAANGTWSEHAAGELQVSRIVVSDEGVFFVPAAGTCISSVTDAACVERREEACKRSPYGRPERPTWEPLRGVPSMQGERRITLRPWKQEPNDTGAHAEKRAVSGGTTAVQTEPVSAPFEARARPGRVRNRTALRVVGGVLGVLLFLSVFYIIARRRHR